MRISIAIMSLGVVMACLCSQRVAAGELSGSAFDHNGSVMEIEAEGNSIEIYYDDPRSGLPVKSGDLLFEGSLDSGTIADGEITGEARTFKSGCDPAPYEVEGTIALDDGVYVIELAGAAPQRSGCRVSGYTMKSDNAHLVFTALDEVGSGSSDDADDSDDDTEDDDSEAGDEADDD